MEEQSSSSDFGVGEGSNFDEAQLLACLTSELSLPSARRCWDFMVNDMTNSKTLVMAAATAAIERPLYSVEGPKKTKTYGDIMLGFDEEFNEAFRLNRSTVRNLVADLKTMPEYRNEDDASVAKSICLFAYFLANKETSLDKIKVIFNMDDLDHVHDEMIRVSKALQDISGRVRLRWPLENESLEIGERFVRKYRFPDVMGVMGFWIFGSFKEGILFQAVVDDMNMYLDINATEINEGRPSPTEFYFRTATYSYVTNFLPQDFNILATSAYPDKIPNVVTPFMGANMSVREKAFNNMVSNCLGILRDTIKLQVKRFPKLVDINLPPMIAKHIILGSCVLHNASIFYHDLAPF